MKQWLVQLPRRDVAVAAAFLVYAVVFQLGRWQGVTPFVFLGGDSGNIASYAAALDHPELFARDSALGDPAELSFYATLHVPLLRLLARLLGDYGSATLSLLWLHVFVQALGFYALGRVLFGSRFWAVLLAIANLVPVQVGLWTYWGAYPDPQPRFSFQALLPFLLVLAVRWRDRPERWPWLAALAGLLVYVHPVSAPGWGLAIWLGLWASWPPGLTRQRRLGLLLLAGLAGLLVAAPFAGVYLTSREHGVSSAAGLAEVYPILRATLPAAYFDPGVALGEFAARWQGAGVFFWLWALVGAVLLWSLGGPERRGVRQLVLWATGLAVVALGIPWLEQWRAATHGAMPVQFDLVRGLRYAVPLALICAIWPLAALQVRLGGGVGPASRRRALLLGVVGTLGVGLWTLRHPPPEIAAAVHCWRSGRLVCPELASPGTRALLDAIRSHTQPGESLLAPGFAAAIRYSALRPVVFSDRDLGVYLYSNHAAVPGWYATRQRLAAILARPDPAARGRALVALARDLGADYLVLSAPGLPRSGGGRAPAVVWRNAQLALLRVSPAPRRSGPLGRIRPLGRTRQGVGRASASMLAWRAGRP